MAPASSGEGFLPRGAARRHAVFTLVTPDRMAHACVLMESVARHHPQWLRFVFVVDRPHLSSAFDDGLAQARPLEDLAIPDLRTRFIKYELAEAISSLTPFGFRQLFAEGFEWVLYLDSEIKVYSEFKELEEMALESSLIVTPYFTSETLESGLRWKEGMLRNLGSLSTGFIALKQTSEIASFLDWWQEAFLFETKGEKGHDRDWLNYGFCLVSDAAILRHPGYNIGYWNLVDRRPEWSGDPNDVPLCAKGYPIRFFHFSGLGNVGADTEEEKILAEWSSRFPFPMSGSASALRTLLADYRRSLQSTGVAKWNGQAPRLGMHGPYEIPKFLREWLRGEAAFQAVDREGWREGSMEEALWEWMQLPDRAYPWLPIFLARTFDSFPGLRETFACESGFFVQDLSTWFESTGRSAAGFGSLFPARGWWTEEKGWEKHLRRAIERWNRGRRGFVPRKVRRRLATGLRRRWLAGRREEASVSAFPIEKKLRINVYGLFLSTIGLAEAARSTVRALQRLGYPTCAIAFGEGSWSSGGALAIPFGFPNDRAQIDILHVNCDHLPGLLKHHPEILSRAKLRIGYWAWELEEPPLGAREMAEFVDEIWCPSEFCAASFRRCTEKPIRVAWHNLDIDAIVRDSDRSVGAELGLEEKCVFLAAADFWSMPERKNPLLALRAYLRAFPSPTADRRLLLKLSNVEADPAYFQKILAESSSRSDIQIVGISLSQAKMFGLLCSTTALISLHSTEGFGLPIAEMRSLGKPVVATAYGGNMDYCTAGNTRLVGYRSAAIPRDFGHYRKGALWAEPIWEEAVPHLQAIYQEWLEGAHREIQPDRSINERSIAMYAENLRALERKLSGLGTKLSEADEAPEPVEKFVVSRNVPSDS
ncbi:hypothetical protein MAMC_01409 [Methylacidimicrobium cyclopophantes]|uniref:Glycosyl transferase family 1 domain-containing protein n=1 Tax=Methylacidimicrobium cyclopophantes TaxID=1041766 RepID=A0A5E6MC69_9BACT|nr:glycosyltransferase [Methylacidimicrobium cyclopophantes]VVM07035.1 hypothetical protein MAMC_01409 [Methylacidimicrobium cyclopophantes]